MRPPWQPRQTLCGRVGCHSGQRRDRGCLWTETGRPNSGDGEGLDTTGHIKGCITYDARMRTTVDLPPAVHRRASQLARERHTSLSAVVAELTTRGLATLDEPLAVRVDVVTGFPTITLGQRVTADEVAEALDDE